MAALLEVVEDFLVGVALVAAYVDGEGAAVGDDVVLCACVDDGGGGLDGTEEGGDEGKGVVAEPVDVVEGVVDGVVAGVAGGVAAGAVGGGVDYHEAFFGLGWLHGGGLADEGYVYLGELGYDAFDALAAADFFFGAGEVDEVVGEGVAVGEYVVGLEEGDD